MQQFNENQVRAFQRLNADPEAKKLLYDLFAKRFDVYEQIKKKTELNDSFSNERLGEITRSVVWGWNQIEEVFREIESYSPVNETTKKADYR